MNAFDKFMEGIKTNREIYNEYVINGNIEMASKYASKMITKSSNYLFFTALYSSIKKCDGEDIRRFLDDLTRKENVHPGVLTMIVQKKLIGQEILEFIEGVNAYDGEYLVFLKVVLSRDLLTADTMSSLLHKCGVKTCESSTEQEIKSLFTNQLVAIIDDWEIYLYALRNKIEISASKSVNYLHYLVESQCCVKSLTELLKRSTSFPEISGMLMNATHYFKPEDETYSLLMQCLCTETVVTPAQISRAYHLYRTKKTLLEFKLLIALLLSTREEKHMILAFKVARDARDDPVYEHRLVYMFIARFFCHCDEFYMSLKKFDVKNVLIPKMYGVWRRLYSSIMDLESLCMDKTKEKPIFTRPCHLYAHYNNQHTVFISDTITRINDTVIHFIESGHHHHAVELLALRDNLLSEGYLQKECYNQFEDFLGTKCAFVFGDTVSGDCAFDKFAMPNIYTINTKQRLTDDIFRNNIEDILCPDFHKFIADLCGKYKTVDI